MEKEVDEELKEKDEGQGDGGGDETRHPPLST